MGANHVLYDRPDLDQTVGAGALYVDGSLPAASTGMPYEGRLQIHNAVGACSVKLLSGTLPGGYALAVDNTTHEVVVTWPAYQTASITLENDFATWKGWEPAYGFTLDAGAARYDGQGEAGIYSPYMPVTPGTSTSLSIQAKCGDSGKQNVGFRSVISWYDADKKYMTIPGVQDVVNNVHTAGTILYSRSGSFVASFVSATVPAGAAFGRAYASCTRNRENKPMWVDNAVWTLAAPSIGAGATGTIPLSVRVTDSAGRTADWSGTVTVADIAYEILVMEDNPVAYWKANETSGTTMADSSGNGHHATYASRAGVTLGAAPLRTGATGSLAVTSKGVGGSVTISGASDPLEIANHSTPWAMECIVKKTATLSSVYGCIFGGNTLYGGCNKLYYRWPDPSQNLIVWDVGSDNRNSPNNTAGTIVHVVVEMLPMNSAPGGNRVVNLYENGRQVYTGTVSSAWHADFAGTLCMLGTTVYLDSYSIAAMGSDFALYDHVLGAERVAAHAVAAGLYVEA